MEKLILKENLKDHHIRDQANNHAMIYNILNTYDFDYTKDYTIESIIPSIADDHSTIGVIKVNIK